MGSISQEKIVEVNMHLLMANCAEFLYIENIAAFVQGTIADAKVLCCNAMFALGFPTLLLNCLMKRMGRSAIE